MGEFSERTFKFIKGNLLNFIVILTSFSYLLYNEVILDSGTELKSATAKILIGIACGLIIKQALGENGFIKGYNSDLWADAFIKYKNVCNTAQMYLEYIDNFYTYLTIKKKEEYRRVNMASGQMKYSWFFNENGEYVENEERYKKLTKKQKFILWLCVRVRIFNLNLFSEQSIDIKSYTKKEKTDGTQRKTVVSRNVIFTVIASFVGGYFTASLGEWSWGSFIMSIIQVCIWLATGFIQLYANYNYITVDKVNKLSQKVLLISQFKQGCEKGLFINKENENDG